MSVIDEINKIPILDIANRLSIKIVKRNSAMCFKGHDKNTPSLSFTPKKNLWYCFSCGIGGSNIQLVKESLDIDFKGTLSWFQYNFGIATDLNYKSFKGQIAYYRKAIVPKDILENTFYEPNHDIFNFLLSKLKLSTSGLNYLKSRGYSEDTIHRLNLLDIASPNFIFELLKSNFPIEDLEKCGLVKYDDKKKLYKFIWWKDTLIIPFYDLKERIIYLQGRSLNPQTSIKYVNLFGLPKPIYNLNQLNKISKGSKIYLFEGVTDCIMGIQSGFNSFGILGASGFKEQWTEYFTNFNINVVPDNDKAGENFSKKITEYFFKIGKRVQIRRIPSGKDFSEFSLTPKRL